MSTWSTRRNPSFFPDKIRFLLFVRKVLKQMNFAVGYEVVGISKWIFIFPVLFNCISASNYPLQHLNFYKQMNIYVGNLSRQAGENELRALFAQFGEVKSVKMIKDQYTGESRGFAFVEMPDTSSANQAINSLDSKDFSGRTLKVNEAKPRENKSFNSFSSNYGYKTRNGY